MPNDNKLVTLEDLKEAIDAKAGVTGVKGDAEQNYRQGDVNLTPADIGAVAKTGDTMTGPLTMNSNLFGALGSTGFRITDESGALSYLCTADDFYGSGGGWNHFIICNHGNGATYYNYVLRLPFGGSPKYKRQTGSTSDQTPWYDFLTSENTVTVLQGGTGATTPAGARNNLGIHTFHGNVEINSNGQGFISFSAFGLSSRPDVCFMEIVNVANTTVRYNYGASTSQIVLEPFWINATPITSTTIEIQGVAFA
jgi:hypothetical protein